MSAKELIDAILLARAAGLKPGEVRQWVEALTAEVTDEDVGGTLVEVETDDDDDEDDGADESVSRLGFK